MRILDRIRSLFGNKPGYGRPGTGRLMSLGGGEEAGRHDEIRDAARTRQFGQPSDTLEDSVRPPLG